MDDGPAGETAAGADPATFVVDPDDRSALVWRLERVREAVAEVDAWLRGCGARGAAVEGGTQAIDANA